MKRIFQVLAIGAIIFGVAQTTAKNDSEKIVGKCNQSPFILIESLSVLPSEHVVLNETKIKSVDYDFNMHFDEVPESTPDTPDSPEEAL